MIQGIVGDPSNNLSEFERQFAINVGGVAVAVRRAIKYLGQGGRIITIGSVVVNHSPFSGISEYSATKATVAGYTSSTKIIGQEQSCPTILISR